MTTTTVQIAEASRSMAKTSTRRRYRARLIEGDRWGSSGYYPREVLERDGPTVWPAGTLMYLDHPSLSEQVERPERSVRDLAGRIATAPVYESDGLYADVDVFPHAQPVIDPLAEADSAALSIRARGTAEQGERDGRTGPVVTALTAGESVDFVTKAGAGGKLVTLLESARQPVTLKEAGSIGAWVESRLHSAFTAICDDMYGYGQLTRDERITLSSAVGSALDSFATQLEADAPQLYARDRWGDPASLPDQPTPMAAEEGSTPAATPVTAAEGARRVHEAATRTNHQGDGKPPTATTQLTEGADMPEEKKTGQPVEGGGTGVTESAATQPIVLGEAAQLTQYLNEARKAQAEAVVAQEAAEKRAKAAEHRALVVEAKHAAEQKVRAQLATSPLTEASHQAVVNAICDSLTVDEDGKADEKALGEAITAEIDRARRHEASILEAHGAGVPRGLGVTGDQHEMTESQFTESLTGLFGELGLDEKTAGLAAKGR